MNRYKVQLWDPPSAPSSKHLHGSLKSKPLIPSLNPLPSGSGLLMTPLSSIRQNTVRTYSRISTTRTHTYSLQWNQHKADFPSWTLLSPYNQTTPSAPQYTGDPPTQINIYIGTATTTSQQNKASSTPWHTEPKQFLHPRIKWTRNFNTSKQHYNTANFHHGPSTSGNTSSPIPTSTQPPPPASPTTTAHLTTTKKGHHCSPKHTQHR